MSPLQSAKFWLVQHLSLAKDALHIYVGLALFLGSALLFRWPLRSWKPWAFHELKLAALGGHVVHGHDVIALPASPQLHFSSKRDTRTFPFTRTSRARPARRRNIHAFNLQKDAR